MLRQRKNAKLLKTLSPLDQRSFTHSSPSQMYRNFPTVLYVFQDFPVALQSSWW